MKTFTHLNTAFFGIVLTVCLTVGFSANGIAQQVISEQDGSSYIRVELMEYSNFSRMLIINDFQKIRNAKVALSDEIGIVYIYPVGQPIAPLALQVKQMVSNAEMLDKEYDKDHKTAVMENLLETNGDWLEQYARTGSRTNENDSCHTAFPFCTNTIYTFPGGTGPGSGSPAQSGPNYDCLSTRPNPAWYYLKILDPGAIAVYMFSTPQRDIDFCLWGPFIDPVTPCPMTNTNGGLTLSKKVDCSYSPNATETANIPNGLTGQYYILVITNFSNQPCDITFQQSGGVGSTDCTILPPPATTNSPVCVGETIELSAATVLGAQYLWDGPAGFQSNVQNPQIANAQFSNGGEYHLAITVGGQTSEPTTTEVFVYDPPTASMTGTTSICEGDSALITISTTGPGPFRAVVSAGSGIPAIINFWQPTHSYWVYPNATTIFTLAGISNNACAGSVLGQAEITVRPAPVPGFSSSNLCSGLQTQFTDMSTITMGGISTWDWTFGDGGTSNLQNPQHSFVNAGLYNVGLTVVSNGGCERSIVLPFAIQPTPVVNAGADFSIAYGTNTQLHGTASGGSGSHTYQWQPANKLVDATILAPNTVLLDATTDFTLLATDNGNACQKSDMVTVTITGGPLSAMIQVGHPEICIGGSTLLNALSSGGSGTYTYSWTSNPPGFTSTLEDVTVNPTVTTTYLLSINDGFTTFNGSAHVIVNMLPVPNAGADQTIPHGTSTTLAAIVTGGTPPYPTYQWTPADKVLYPQSVLSPTVNLYESQNFTVQVTDIKGCTAEGQTVVTISGGPLQVNPIAVQPVICRNESTSIRAIAGGGNTEDPQTTYTWTSDPAGFSSSLPDPIVTPVITTTYTVLVDDGYNTTTGSVTVTVNQLPQIDLIPHDNPKVLEISPTEIGICVYDTIVIDAGNAGAGYLWSNGSTEQFISMSTSGLSFDIQQYSVTVTNPQTGCIHDAQLTASFTFENCNYGIDENAVDNRLQVYPNPSADGLFRVVVLGLSGDAKLDVYSAHGKLLNSDQIHLVSGSSFESDLQLNNQPGGVYYLRLTGNEATILKRLIIRK